MALIGSTGKSRPKRNPPRPASKPAPGRAKYEAKVTQQQAGASGPGSYSVTAGGSRTPGTRSIGSQGTPQQQLQAGQQMHQTTVQGTRALNQKTQQARQDRRERRQARRASNTGRSSTGGFATTSGGGGGGGGGGRTGGGFTTPRSFGLPTQDYGNTVAHAGYTDHGTPVLENNDSGGYVGGAAAGAAGGGGGTGANAAVQGVASLAFGQSVEEFVRYGAKRTKRTGGKKTQ